MELKKKLVAFGSSLAVLPYAVHAAVPAAVTTAISDMEDDALAVATAFLVATIVVIAFLFMRKGAR
jgi:hypothetical protein